MRTLAAIALVAASLWLAGTLSASAAPDSPTYVIWGYAGSQSVVQGGAIDLYVSTRAPTYDLIFYRYGAKGREQVARVNGFPGAWRDCPNSHLGCGWPMTYRLAVPTTWRSGLYLVRLLTPGEDAANDNGEWIWFVVREDDPGSTSPVLWMLNEFTWQAYNYRNGLSFYPDEAAGRGRANYLSFDRPYAGPCPPDWGLCPAQKNLPLIRWLESNGYVVEYAANYDVHSIPDLLSHYRMFMDDWHDEYWSWEMRDQVENFIAQGGNAAFFSSNTSYWQVRLEDNGRTLVGFKSEVHKDPVLLDGDPTNDRLATTNWCAAPVNRCETRMLGITYFNGGNAKKRDACPFCTGGFEAWSASHWAYAGTGVKNGQLYGDKDTYGSYVGIAAVEVDGALWQNTASGPVISKAATDQGTPSTFVILARSLAMSPFGLNNAAATMGVYTNTAGATVWSSSSWDWQVVGLSAKNPIVEKVTRNVLSRLAFSEPWPETRTVSQALGAGWNLISVPLNTSSTAVADVLADIAGQYDLVEAYDGCQPADPWRIYDPAAPPFVNTLSAITPSQGIWLHTTAGTDLALTGKPLASDVTLALCTGWNLIGYPSLTERDVATVLAPIAGRYDLVEAYEGTDPANPWRIYDPAAPPFVNTLSRFVPGRGYWLHMLEPASLTIPR